jgi:hypothetical protein
MISISEEADTIAVELGGKIRTDSRDAEYEELKRMILNSQVWRKSAEIRPKPMFWVGAPGDILIVKHREAGLTLQGNRIPKEWKRRILEFIR